jgi:type II secretory pathway pseudopilin PulG
MKKGAPPENLAHSEGFSLIETLIAMFIIMIAMLGTLQAINYSVTYNAGNATRAQSLAILQQEAERLRAAKFTPAGVDSEPLPADGKCQANAQRDITGGAKNPCTINAPNGGDFIVRTWVDDNPYNAPNTYDVVAGTRIKEITIEVGLASPSPGWQMAIPARVVLRRTIGN